MFVHRTTFHRAVAHGNTGKNQEPAQTLACKHTEQLVFSKDFRSSKSSSVWTQTRKALNGHERDGFATPSREPAGASLQLLMQTGNEMGGLFLLIKWQREWDHCCIPSMHAQHWAATE